MLEALDAETTVYSYLKPQGLWKYKNEEAHELVAKCFPPLNRRHHRVTQGKLHDNNTLYLALKMFLINLTGWFLMVCKI